jgi:valyl-tRNA synthetase
MGIGPAVKAPLFIETSDASVADFIPYLKLLARLTEGSIVATLPADDAPVAMSGNARLMLKVEVDKAAETARLTKELGKLDAELAKLTANWKSRAMWTKPRRTWWSVTRRNWPS